MKRCAGKKKSSRARLRWFRIAKLWPGFARSSRELQLHPEAEAELTGAALYYAKEASRSIALAFLAEFERVAEMVEENQQLGTKSKAGLRVYPFRRFPYSIVYRELAGGPYVYGVAHQRQEPGYWLGRV